MFAWSISAPEIATLLLLAVLLFGKKLPEIAGSMGRTVRTFQNGWRGIEDDMIDTVARREPAVRNTAPKRIASAVPKFDECTGVLEPPVV